MARIRQSAALVAAISLSTVGCADGPTGVGPTESTPPTVASTTPPESARSTTDTAAAAAVAEVTVVERVEVAERSATATSAAPRRSGEDSQSEPGERVRITETITITIIDPEDE